jgi:hypothetical protein
MAGMATPIEQAPPEVRETAERNAPDRPRWRAEAAALLQRHRAGEPGIILTAEELGRALRLDDDPDAQAV